MTRGATCALLSILVCIVLTASMGHAAPAPKPDAQAVAATAEAKKNFEVGLKLYKDGLVKEALAAFLAANKISPRASVQRNIGQCQRDLKDFAGAFETYTELLEKFGATMKAAETADVKRAIDELGLLTGALEVKSSEADATVTIDDNEIGKTPLAKPKRVNLGAHAVSVTKGGFEPFSKQVTIRGNDQVTLEAALEKEIKTGHLAVAGMGPGEGVVLSVDGKEVGPLPWEGDLAPGSHQVEARGPKSAAMPQQVEIRRREKSELTLQLQPQTAMLYVDPHNAQAQIALDGNVVGRGVWEGTVSAERHELTVTAPLYKTLQRVFVAHVGERVTETTPLQLEEGVSLHDFRGLYVGIDLFGRFEGTTPTNEFAEKCPVLLGSCDFSKSGGFGGLLRVGYSFGWLGAEVIGMGSADFASAEADYSPYYLPASMTVEYGRHEKHHLSRAGAGGGLGVRATSKHSTIRFTGGMGLALALRSIHDSADANIDGVPSGNCGNSPCFNSETRNWDTNASKAIPVLLFDTSLLLGSTPGTKFRLGALMAVEFYGDPLVTDAQPADNAQGITIPRPGIQLAHGTSVFIGPMLGLQFGE